MSKSLRFLQITAYHQDCPFFTIFLTIKTSSQNISITLLQISLKLNKHRGGYCSRERFWMNSSQCREIMLQIKQVMQSFRCCDNSDFIATLIIKNFHLYLIQLWWQFFQIFCLWRRNLFSNLGGIHPEKLYRATIKDYFLPC